MIKSLEIFRSHLVFDATENSCKCHPRMWIDKFLLFADLKQDDFGNHLTLTTQNARWMATSCCGPQLHVQINTAPQLHSSMQTMQFSKIFAAQSQRKLWSLTTKTKHNPWQLPCPLHRHFWHSYQRDCSHGCSGFGHPHIHVARCTWNRAACRQAQKPECIRW